MRTESGTLQSSNVGDDISVGDPVTFGSFNGTLFGSIVVDGVGFPIVEFLTNRGLTRYALLTQSDDPANFPYPNQLRIGQNANVDTDDPFTTCFAVGTLIATPTGEKRVEELSAGDIILSSDGKPVSVLWIGRQTVSKLFTPADRFRPIRVAACALGENMPHTHLVVTADHALLVGGVLVNAGALVNGTTITRVPVAELDDKVDYYHIEAEAHELVRANGTPGETFVDNVTRRSFDNYAEFVALFGDEGREAVEMPHPRAMSRRQLPQSVVEDLDSRAVALAQGELSAA